MAKTWLTFKALLEAGAVGFSDDGIPLESSKVVKEAMEELKNSTPLSAYTRKILVWMVR